MTVGQLSASILGRLTPRYGDREAKAMLRVILEHTLNYTPVDAVIRRDNEVPPFIPDKTDSIVRRLLADEPLQYITGEARFCGHTLRVTPRRTHTPARDRRAGRPDRAPMEGCARRRGAGSVYRLGDV